MPRNKFRGANRNYNDRQAARSQEHFDDDFDSRSGRYRDERKDEEFPRFRGGKIGRNKPKKGNKFRFDRQLEEDFSTGREEEQEQRRPAFTKGFRKGHGDLWHKIMIKDVKAPKDIVLKSIIAAAPVPVVPVYYHIRGPNAFFYVESSEMAHSITRLKITLPTGDRLSFGAAMVCPIPSIPVDENMQAKLRQVLERKYNAVSQSLDLSNFHYDESLCHEYYAPLFRPYNMMEVLRIITENIPQLRGLDISNNKLTHLDHLEVLVNKSIELKALNVADNRITSIAGLMKLKGLPLESLWLTGNPIRERLLERGPEHYRSEMRRLFPKLMELDDERLPPPVTFDIEPEGFKVPETQQTFLVTDGARDILQTFLQQYYALYDQGRRNDLAEAYHEEGMFSMTSGQLPKNEDNQARLGPYMNDTRNLTRIKDPSLRVKFLKRGREEVIKLLEKLPKTEHDPSSFRVDVTIVTETLMSINLKGVFREELDNKTVLRSFMRFLMLVPTPTGGFCITNEMLYVTNATQAQKKVAFKPVEAPPQPVPQAVATTSIGLMPGQQELIAQFSAQSGMNAEFSKQCLESRSWDYAAAAELFQQMVAANAIPPEAFNR